MPLSKSYSIHSLASGIQSFTGRTTSTLHHTYLHLKQLLASYNNPFKNTKYEVKAEQTKRNIISKYKWRWKALIIPSIIITSFPLGVIIYIMYQASHRRELAYETMNFVCSDITSKINIELSTSSLIANAISGFAFQSYSNVSQSIYEFNIISEVFNSFLNTYRYALLAPLGTITNIYPSRNVLGHYINRSVFEYSSQQILETIQTGKELSIIESDPSSSAFNQITILPIYSLINTTLTGILSESYDDICLRNDQCYSTNVSRRVVICDDACRCGLLPETKKLWGFILIMIPLTRQVFDFIFAQAFEKNIEFQWYLENNMTTLIAQSSDSIRDLHTTCANAYAGTTLILSSGYETFDDTSIVFIVTMCALSALTCIFVYKYTSQRNRYQNLIAEFVPQRMISKVMRGDPIKEYYPNVTVLFCDIVGYTVLSTQITPDDMIKLLDTLYSRFDDLIDLHGCYKTDIIGDALMCMAGCPEREHEVAAARRIAHLAFDMLDITQMIATELSVDLKIRIGLNSGPVHGCILGKRVPHFYPFGDNVNIASRMESHGIPGHIHISLATAKLLAGLDEFYVIPREPVVHIKGKGEMPTYFLERNTEHYVNPLRHVNTVGHLSNLGLGIEQSPRSSPSNHPPKFHFNPRRSAEMVFESRRSYRKSLELAHSLPMIATLPTLETLLEAGESKIHMQYQNNAMMTDTNTNTNANTLTMMLTITKTHNDNIESL